jgi:hypothetical protein
MQHLHSSDPASNLNSQELTVLGFIALLVFMSVKTGIPQVVSKKVRWLKLCWI